MEIRKKVSLFLSSAHTHLTTALLVELILPRIIFASELASSNLLCPKFFSLLFRIAGEKEQTKVKGGEEKRISLHFTSPAHLDRINC